MSSIDYIYIYIYIYILYKGQESTVLKKKNVISYSLIDQFVWCFPYCWPNCTSILFLILPFSNILAWIIWQFHLPIIMEVFPSGHFWFLRYHSKDCTDPPVICESYEVFSSTELLFFSTPQSHPSLHSQITSVWMCWHNDILNMDLSIAFCAIQFTVQGTSGGVMVSELD